MRIRFCGVRGSSPVAGPEFAMGGHTSCVAVSLGDDLPTLILDAGTGLLPLARLFAGRPFRGTILLTHLHWDHVNGLPFFPPADRPDAETTLVQPNQGDPLELLAESMCPPHFPIRPDELDGAWHHVALDPGTHEIGPFTVVAVEVTHKGGRTFGYRIDHDGRSFCYLPDALDDNDEATLALANDVDLFVRGAPFVAAEQARADLYGHGTVDHALDLAARSGARRLLLTHHGPMRTDDQLVAIAADKGVEFARDGQVVDV